MFRSLLLLFTAAVLIFSSYAAAAAETKGVQTAQAPSWAGKTWIDGNSYLFSGISGIADNLADARQQAYLDALSKAAQYLGISLSAATNYSVTSDASALNSSTNITTDQTQLTQGIIRDFQYTQDKNGIVGYILIEYDKADIERERQRKEKVVEQEKRRLSERSKVDIAINLDERLKDLAADIRTVFSKLGYKIVPESDTLLNVKIANESYQNVRNGMIMCVLKVEFSLGQKMQVLEAFAYGKTQEEAFQKTVQRLSGNLAGSIDPKIF
ncbi:MAG: hypothetical protein LBC07_05410 [Elusimicrobiota bacterium]|jgi:hypothetical protein|nr:hypothetical protein [Elusimicrobiota bacterium]